MLQCAHDIVMSYGLVFSMFLIGLVGGMTHCVGMCSPFVLAQVGDGRGLQRLGSTLLLPYHLGRMTTYVVMAVLVNSLINLAFIFSDLKSLVAAPMLVAAGIIFLVSAFPWLSVLFPWAVNIKISVGAELIVSFSRYLMNSSSIFCRYALGVLLGFMPCGLVVSALMASATAPNVLGAGVSMAAFAIGTMPSLILVSLGGRAFKHKYPKYVSIVSRGAMLVSCLWLFILAGAMVL